MKVKLAVNKSIVGGRGVESLFFCHPSPLSSSSALLKGSRNKGGLMGMITHETTIRFFHLGLEVNYILPTPPLPSESRYEEDDDIDEEDKAINRDPIVCGSFNNTHQLLAVGTKRGRIVVWKYCPDEASSSYSPSSNDWTLIYLTTTHEPGIYEEESNVTFGMAGGWLESSVLKYFYFFLFLL